MIALTKEKREKLIKGIKGYLYVCEDDFDRIVYEVALASLMAEPVNPADCFDTVYLYPPVAEIKLPSAGLIKEVFLANGFKEKTQPDGNVDLNPYVYDAAIALIKRLNGLGD